MATLRSVHRPVFRVIPADLDGILIPVTGLQRIGPSFCLIHSLVHGLHDINLTRFILRYQFPSAVSGFDHSGPAGSVLIVFFFYEAALGIADLMDGKAFPAVDRLICFIEILLADQTAHLIEVLQNDSIAGILRYDTRPSGIQMPFGSHIAQVVIGIQHCRIAHGSICQVLFGVIIRHFCDIPKLVVRSLLDGISPLADTQVLSAVIVTH